MRRTVTRILLSTCIIAFMNAGCSKKIAKIQPEPEPKPKIEQAYTPPAGADFSVEQDMDARMREIFIPIYFDYDKYELKRSEMPKLERIASFLNENTGVRVLIEGYCDERGSSEYNMGLGENRARTVKKWLASYGIADVQLESTSYGKERPAAFGCADDGCHARNRRDEWKVLAK